MNKEPQISQPIPDFGALLESVRENGRLMREAAEHHNQEWEKRFVRWEQERLKRNEERERTGKRSR